MKSVETPELDKRHEALAPRPVNDVLSEFYDWLLASGYVIARYGNPREGHRKCRTCHGSCRDGSKMTPRQRQLLILGALEDEDWPVCETCDGNGWIGYTYVDDESLAPTHESPTTLFAKFLEIDLAQIDVEQRAILDSLNDRPPDGYELVGDTWKKVCA